MKVTFFLMITLLLTSCASPMVAQRAKLESWVSCCQTPAEFNYLPIAVKKVQKLVISDTSPAFTFSTGKSYFTALELEQGNRRIIHMESWFSDDYLGQFLHPLVTFLDRNKNPITTTTPSLRYIPPALTPPFPVAHIGSSVSVPDTAVFVVIHTKDFRDEKLTVTYLKPRGMFTPGGTSEYPRKSFSRSLTGELSITLYFSAVQ